MAVKKYKKGQAVKLSKNFWSTEFDSNGNYPESKDTYISEELVELLQKLRDYFKKPIKITSGYRDPKYNKDVGGSPRSQHLRGLASDIVIEGIDPLLVALLSEHLLGEKGGVGKYDSFTHVDVRETKSRWDFRTKKL